MNMALIILRDVFYFAVGVAIGYFVHSLGVF